MQVPANGGEERVLLGTIAVSEREDGIPRAYRNLRRRNVIVAASLARRRFWPQLNEANALLRSPFARNTDSIDPTRSSLIALQLE